MSNWTFKMLDLMSTHLHFVSALYILINVQEKVYSTVYIK